MVVVECEKSSSSEARLSRPIFQILVLKMLLKGNTIFSFCYLRKIFSSGRFGFTQMEFS